MPDLDSEIVRINYEMEEEPVTVIPLRDYPNLRLDGMHFNLLKDRENGLPLWIAEVLESRGIIRIKTEEEVSLKTLKEIIHQEGKRRELTQLDSLLFRRVRAEIDRLRKENTGEAMRRLTNIEGNFRRIIRIRKGKIYQSSILKDEHYNLKTFTKEEQWLVDKLNEIYSRWEDAVGFDTSGGV